MKKCKKIELKIRYINKEEKKIRLFGDKFIDNNKNNCKIYYNGKEYELETFIMKQNFTKTLEIKLRVYKDITNMSYMFSDCNSLVSLFNISNLNTDNVINMLYVL